MSRRYSENAAPAKITVEWPDGALEYLEGEDAARWWHIVSTVCRLHFRWKAGIGQGNPFEELNWKQGRVKK